MPHQPTTLQNLKANFASLFAEPLNASELNAQFFWWLDFRLGFTKRDYILGSHQAITQQQQELVALDFDALQKGVPLQYVLGQVAFGPLQLHVGPGCLIPRPETEEMLQKICNHGPYQNILDVGTGSGCLALGLKHRYPAAIVTALDVSEAALAIAQTNAQHNQLEVQFLNTNFLAPENWADLPKINLLVSNPPYIPLAEATEMAPHVLNHEPHEALFVPNTDPLVFYRALLQFATTHLNKGGQIWCEIHYLQHIPLLALAKMLGFYNATILEDLFGKPRFLHIKTPQ